VKTYQTLTVTVTERIARLTINRPEKLNALNAMTKEELREVLVSLAEDSTVAVVILTGAGDKSFVAGTDIEELTTLDRTSGEKFAAGGQEVLDLLENLDKPVIAAVNGFALGGGCELAMACHVRFASDRARFGQPEVNLGIIPGYGGTQRLARLVGKGRALELILSGNIIDAAEAFRIGLVNRVVPHDQLLRVTEEFATSILARGPRAISLALKAVRAGDNAGLAEGQKIEAALFGECCTTEDFREGTRAFLEKRKPVFRGR
jgi:enoyl-CoA hydratase